MTTCFMWAVLSALFPTSTHADRLSNYLHHENAIDCSSLRFPLDPKQFLLFERDNFTIAIHCLAYNKFSECFSIFYPSPHMHLCPHKISLLLLDLSDGRHGTPLHVGQEPLTTSPEWTRTCQSRLHFLSEGVDSSCAGAARAQPSFPHSSAVRLSKSQKGHVAC